MSSAYAAPRAAVPVSSARAEASRRNGAKSRGPRTPEGKARSAQNALKHGLRAHKHVVLADEDAEEFAGLEAALVAELAPVGALQMVLARRVAVAAWRLMRADRLEGEVFAQRGYDGAAAGLALIRDGNGTRSFDTLLRYRGAAMAEFWRALRTLKALQAEPALASAPAPRARPLEAHPEAPAGRGERPPLVPAPRPKEPERGAGRGPDHAPGASGAAGQSLHDPAASWLPNEPEPHGARHIGARPADLVPNEPDPHRAGRPGHGRTTPPLAPAPTGRRATAHAGP